MTRLRFFGVTRLVTPPIRPSTSFSTTTVHLDFGLFGGHVGTWSGAG